MARREAVVRTLRQQVVTSQEELGRLLRAQGFKVTQATLSRDLARLGARWVSLPEGGGAYELPGAPVPTGGQEGLRSVHGLVAFVEAAQAMVVVRTKPGAASVVAAAIDASRHPGVLGTLAGDDTLFIVPKKGHSPNRVQRTLAGLWKKALHS